MSMVEVSDAERRIAEKIDSNMAEGIDVSSNLGGLAFTDLAQVMEFAKVMSIASIAIPEHLRKNPGACLAVCMQAVEWRMSPFAVANKSYSVNNRLAFEAQLVQAVILSRAPIDGRIKCEYTGEGTQRRCRVWAKLRDSEEIVEYISPAFEKINPKNSPLWKNDPDQQLWYFSARAWSRRHFPDVLLGVFAKDELVDAAPMRDVTPQKSKLAERLAAAPKSEAGFSAAHVESELSGTIAGNGADEGPDAAQPEPSQSEPAASGPQQSEEPEPTSAPAEAADAPLPDTGAVEPDPYLKGRDARRKGMKRSVVPGEYRSDDDEARENLRLYREGWDAEDSKL